MIGSISAWFGGPELAKIKLLGHPMGGDMATAGPIRDPNFPWVLLGRACLHLALISERNHVVRNQLVAELENDEHFFAFSSTSERMQVERLFGKIRQGDNDARTKLSLAIQSVMGTYQAQQVF